MARYVDTIDLPLPIEEAFDYLAAFDLSVDWDPGVVAARALTPGEPRVGSRFRVVASFLGRELPLVYEIRELERPTRILLEGSDGSLRSIDEITFAPRGQGTRVTYEARLELSGLRRLLDPALHLVFQYIGQQASAGLRRRVERDVAAARRSRPAARRGAGSPVASLAASGRAKPAKGRARPARRRAKAASRPPSPPPNTP